MKKILFITAAALLAFTGCVKDEVYKGPSSIDKVVFTPEAPTSTTPVTVTATVTGLQAVTSASLKYNGMTASMSGSGSDYTAVIPAMPDGTEVSFTVEVVNEAGFTTTSDKFSYKVGDPATDWTKLKLNEVSGAGNDEDKFFELYNASDYPIKLTGVTINKDEGLCWTGIDGEVVAPKEASRADSPPRRAYASTCSTRPATLSTTSSAARRTIRAHGALPCPTTRDPGAAFPTERAVG